MAAVGTEEILGEILDNAPCGFVSFGDDGRITSINQTLLQRLGYAREELVDHHFESLLAIGGRIFYQTHFFPLVKLHGRAQEVFLLLRARNGDDVGMLCNAVRHQRGDHFVIDCVLMEVVERRKFEEALLQARQAAERANVALEARTREADEANKAKSTFLAVMSHELRTPLNAIGGYVQLLEMGVHGPVTKDQLDTLARIDRSQRHLLRLINDVLNLARIEAGRVEYVIDRVSLSDEIAGVLPMVEPQIASKKHRFESAVADGLFAKADREKLQQILLNLLTNAIKFTPSGGSVRVEAGVSSPEQLFVRVIDSGVGIPADMLEKIFEPFIQVDTTGSRPGEGTGLGLAISRDLARGMGGDLSAESKQGVGSTFQLTLSRS